MKRAVLLLLCLILMLPMCAVSEEIYLDDASGVYESVFPDTLLILNVLMVDIDPDIAADNGQITCEIRNIYCPPGEYVYGVLLFDGWRGIPGYFEYVPEARLLRIRFTADTIQNLDSYSGLYLIVLGQLTLSL